MSKLMQFVILIALVVVVSAALGLGGRRLELGPDGYAAERAAHKADREERAQELRERDTERRAIALCWEEYERKSLDPPTKRAVAATCEKMEQDFRHRFGRNP
jgi:hypothetical protein